jgi:hypothetical protein
MVCAIFDVPAYVSYPALRSIMMHSATALEYFNSDITRHTQGRHAPGADVRVSGDEMRLQTFTAHSAGLLYLGNHRLIALTAV